MKRIYFLLFIALFQQSLELNWNPLSTLGKSLWDSRNFLFRLVFPNKDIAYYSKQLDKKVEELNKRNYNPKGYKVCANIMSCPGEGFPYPTLPGQIKPISNTRLQAIKRFITDELIKCMHEKNKDMENEFKRLSAEIHFPSVITKAMSDRAIFLCRGRVCPVGLCVAAGGCRNQNDANKAGRMGEIIEKSADAFIPCAKSLLDRQY